MRSASSSSCEDLGPDLLQAARELGLGLREGGLGVRGLGVDQGARGEQQPERTNGRVGIVDDAAPHAPGVVGDNPADGGEVGARRVGAELSPIGCEDPIDVPERRARAHARPRPLRLDLHAGEVAPDVDEDALALSLAVEARAAGAKGERRPVAPRVPEELGQVIDAARHHHGLREQAVRARV